MKFTTLASGEGSLPSPMLSAGFMPAASSDRDPITLRSNDWRRVVEGTEPTQLGKLYAETPLGTLFMSHPKLTRLCCAWDRFSALPHRYSQDRGRQQFGCVNNTHLENVVKDEECILIPVCLDFFLLTAWVPKNYGNPKPGSFI